MGLIEPAKRSDGRYRLYSRDALTKIEFIKKCQAKRLSLEEIQEAIRSGISPEQVELDLCIMNASLAIDEAISELEGIDSRLKRISDSDLAQLKEKAGMLLLKTVTASELLQMILHQV